MIKWSIHQGDTSINTYEPNIRAPEYVRQILPDLNGEIPKIYIIIYNNSGQRNRIDIFPKKTPMTNRYMRRCSASRIIRETPIKTIMRYHLTLVRMAISKKDKRQVLARMWRNCNPRALLVGMQTRVAAVENSMEGPQKS